jgi:hypothetical protein
MTAVTPTREELEAAGLSVVEEVDWEDTEILRPGMDFKDGTVFVTVSAKLNVDKMVGKGKNAKIVREKIPGLACVTSEGKQFAYVPERVAEWGFDYPKTVTTPDQRRWSKQSIEEFRHGETSAPNPATLWQGIRAVYEEYIEFAREEYYDLMPMFVMGSYMFRLYKAIGYLHFNGTAASGKSQNLRILDALAFNTQWASSMSSAALYRSLAGHPGTVCIDEAEGFEGERGEELRRILNAGYLDGSTVKRAEKGPGDVFIVQSYESYGPKAIASINVLDNVIGSRCLIVAMRPAIRTIREFDKDDPRWQRLRDRLYLWLMYHAKPMSEVIERWNDTDRYTRAPTLVGRSWQITQMYVTIADYIDSFDKGDRCNRLITFFTEYFADLAKQQDATDRIRLVLRVLPEVLRLNAPDDEHFFHLKDVHEVVSNYLEEDQKEYYKTRQLSKHLDVLGFKKRRAHRKGQQVWLDPAQIRQEFKQRRVEPVPEDVAWLAGEVEYSPKASGSAASMERVSVWADVAEIEES